MLGAFLVGAVVAAVGCADDSSTGGDADSDVGKPDSTSSSGEFLELRIAGRVDGDLLCPGDRRPCIRFTGPVDLGAGDLVWVTGRLVGGALEVDGQRELPESHERDYSNRCGDDDLPVPPSDLLLESIYEGETPLPDAFADAWDSEDGVLHIGVAGDVGPTERYLDEIGATGQVCIVTGFPYPDAVLERVQAAAGAAATDAGYDNWGSTRDVWEGTVTISLPRLGFDLRARLDEISAESDVPIQVEASVEVLNGSVEDYEQALETAAVAPDPAAELTARCGAVTFADVPPDLDEFPPLDDDAQSALDELLTGPTGVEAAGMFPNTQWSLALRTENRLVLFGQPEDPGTTDWSDVRFDKRDASWTPVGWGGCRIQIEAPGLGPATVGIDPANEPEPGDTQLSLLINEQACASGRAPDDREVVVLTTETAESVSILALVAPVEGGAECPGNPWYPISVELDAPLGDRELLDAHQYPPRVVEQVDP